jgi:hypothetical protein
MDTSKAARQFGERSVANRMDLMVLNMSVPFFQQAFGIQIGSAVIVTAESA